MSTELAKSISDKMFKYCVDRGVYGHAEIDFTEDELKHFADHGWGEISAYMFKEIKKKLEELGVKDG